MPKDYNLEKLEVEGLTMPKLHKPWPPTRRNVLSFESALHAVWVDNLDPELDDGKRRKVELQF